ncbi:D-2-hydroxyacid dehydrogenase [Marinomonas ostreistagni]|uniref:D-2-hydroxyacid dehydrogenase n=1 Tax=Marinomonas ostreistagni TaxID=359209 RepID=UPI00194ED750|nr:D-2-hydroxyacid dehydrogenase [Marinomonas ostreistagni]MBM6550016.1 D-2-hydroxyacid dehydrogenase [Marinomonas ostreistagni]
MKAVFLDRGSFPETTHIPLPKAVTESEFYHNTAPNEVLARIQDADIVMTNKVVLDRSALAEASSLKLVQVMATGTNNVDIAACDELGIGVQNVSGYSTVSVPEHTFALILELRRNLTRYRDAVRAGRWSESEFFCFMDYPIRDLSGATLCIIGSGTLGQRVAEIGRAFGMQVIFAERKHADSIREGFTEFKSAIAQADIISFHCPLTEQTRHMLDAESFVSMKPSALVINTGRGGLVDEQALADALRTGQIAGAGFDVATTEPMPKDHPLQSLTELPNFILTPHVAWASESAMDRLLAIACDNMSKFIESYQA